MSDDRAHAERLLSDRPSGKVSTGKPVSGRPVLGKATSGKAAGGKTVGLRGAPRGLPRAPRLWSVIESVRSPTFGVLVSVSIAVLVGAALLHVWTRLEVIRIGYALSEQTKLHRALREHEQRLRLELATQKDPAAIERVAREQLHMAPPDPSSIRILGHTGPAGRARSAGLSGATRPGGGAP